MLILTFSLVQVIEINLCYFDFNAKAILKLDGNLAIMLIKRKSKTLKVHENRLSWPKKPSSSFDYVIYYIKRCIFQLEKWGNCYPCELKGISLNYLLQIRKVNKLYWPTKENLFNNRNGQLNICRNAIVQKYYPFSSRQFSLKSIIKCTS